ncbi:hypothetical protein THAOC_11798, partial [Thalassiosira oceanica]
RVARPVAKGLEERVHGCERAHRRRRAAAGGHPQRLGAVPEGVRDGLRVAPPEPRQVVAGRLGRRMRVAVGRGEEPGGHDERPGGRQRAEVAARVASRAVHPDDRRADGRVRRVGRAGRRDGAAAREVGQVGDERAVPPVRSHSGEFLPVLAVEVVRRGPQRDGQAVGTLECGRREAPARFVAGRELVGLVDRLPLLSTG